MQVQIVGCHRHQHFALVAFAHLSGKLRRIRTATIQMGRIRDEAQ